jgi:hypothetical protein
MASEPVIPESRQEAVEMPRPTAAPLVLSVGVAVLGAGIVFGPLFIIVGLFLFAVGLGGWVRQLLPGVGHFHEAFVAPEHRAQPVAPVPGAVTPLRPGVPGYRLRLPIEVHPISAGIKGGMAGGLVMPVPAVLWGLLSGHGIWYPVNLLAGMMLPGIEELSVAELEAFRPTFLLVGIVIHIAMSVVLGMLYGVLLPTLPEMPKPLAWGGLLMPMLWTAVGFLLMRFVNPLLQDNVDWPWFIVSQFIFGLAAACVVLQLPTGHPIGRGLLAGVLGGIAMTLPALLWGLASGHGIWYPVNLLAGMAIPAMDGYPVDVLEQYRPNWLLTALAIHAVLSISFGIIYGLVLPRVPRLSAAITWGALLMPLFWTALSYLLMGVVNPLLQEHIEWPWFIVSQFVFGLAAAVVVDRSEKVHIPPAGQGGDSLESFATGAGEPA